jgi:hypothetical protein
MGQWVDLVQALQSLGVTTSVPTDGGDFTTGDTEAISDQVFDAGNFASGQCAAVDNQSLSGGLITGND